MKTRTILFFVLLASISLVSIQLAYANISSILTTFQKPNIKLQIINNTILIPEEVGHLNKQYQHEEFAELMKQEIAKAEIIRDSLIISPIQEK